MLTYRVERAIIISQQERNMKNKERRTQQLASNEKLNTAAQ